MLKTLRLRKSFTKYAFSLHDHDHISMLQMLKTKIGKVFLENKKHNVTISGKKTINLKYNSSMFLILNFVCVCRSM